MAHDARDAVGVEDLLVLLSREKAGDKDVHAHLVRRPLAGEVEREVVHRALRRRVGEYARQRHHARHRAEVDDRATLAALDEVFAEHLAAEKHALQIHGHDAVELFLRDVEERGRGIHARAVDDDVDAAAALEHGVEDALHFRFARRFRGVEPRLATGRRDLREPGVRFFLTAADDDDFGARACETFGHRTAEFAGAAGDDGNLAGKTKHFVKVVAHK